MHPGQHESTLAGVLDRFAIRDLIDAYAHHADRRDPVGQAAVFAADGEVRLFVADPTTAAPVDTVNGRDALIATFTDLISRYEATTYLNGQSVVTVDGDTATAESYCLAHHTLRRDGRRRLLVMAIRYLDWFDRTPDGWRITRRDLVFDWTDERDSVPQS